MMLAASDNSVATETISFLIEQGAKVNAVDSDGNTALMYASEHAVPILLKAGAKVNAVNSDGNTALMYASEHVVPILLKAGANLEHKNKNGETALMISVRNRRNTAAAFLLIEAGADIMAADNQGKTS
jgi:ankyrin repeat protein